MKKEPAKTPLHRCHLQQGARMVPFAGFEMPVQYSGVLVEAKTVRSSCGLFDVSHMGQVVVRGKNALSELNKLVTNNLATLSVGQAQYNILCNENGGTIDDLVIYKRQEQEFYICVNAANHETDAEWMRSHLSKDVSFEDVSESTALIALQGPRAEELLSATSDQQKVKDLNYYWSDNMEVLGHPCFISRTGYTGEDGFELYFDRKHAIDIWEGFLERGQKYDLIPVGLGARDTLRLEMGYALHGHELSNDISPLSAGLSWVVKLNKETPFIGQRALQKEKKEGSPHILKAFVIDDRRIPRPGYRIATQDRETVGSITSGTLSPHLNCPIALGFVEQKAAKNPNLLIEIRENYIPLKAVKLPFVESKTKRPKKSINTNK